MLAVLIKEVTELIIVELDNGGEEVSFPDDEVLGAGLLHFE
jgi:hypothetical protein